jgi:hypothetical protein
MRYIATTTPAPTPPPPVFEDPVYTPNPAYRLCLSAEEIDEALGELQQAPVFSFDTETTGLNVAESVPIGVSFSAGPDRCFYIPVHDRHLLDPRAVTSEVVVRYPQYYCVSGVSHVLYLIYLAVLVLFRY